MESHGSSKASQSGTSLRQRLHHSTQPITYTADEERALVRKVDRFILPLLCTVFFLQYLDKQSLSYASVFGLIPDLHLNGSQYSWCSSIFYIGQLVAEYPFIYLMSRFSLTKFIGLTIIVWGGVCMCLAAPTNFAGFATVRFLLGFCEGAVSPAFVTVTSIWYQKKEHPLRIGAWVTMNGLAQVIGSLLMYGIGKNGSISLASWRVLFLICGALTAASGVLFMLWMPINPDSAWFFNDKEKLIVAERMANDRESGDQTNFSRSQAKEALTDARAIFVFIFGVLVTMQSPVLTFASLIIKNLHYDKFQTMLYTAPSGAVQIAFIWLAVLGCQLLPRKRCLIVIILSIPPLVANLFLLKLPISSGWGMVVSSWLASCISDVMAVTLSLSASNVKGNTKRAMVNTYYFIGYSVGCIAAPQLWKAGAAPRFKEGVITAIVTWCLLIIFMVSYWLMCRTENRRRELAARTNHESTEKSRKDMTDKEDLLFRYNY